MHINKNFKKRLHTMLSLLLVLLMLSSSFTGMVFADDQGGGTQEETLADKEGTAIETPVALTNSTGAAITIAAWIFNDEGDKDTFFATDGTYKQASTFRAEGGPSFEEVDNSKNELKYQGWDNGTLKKYWLAAISTKGYENITLSSEQTSSGSGPRDFKVQISSDGQNWTDVENNSIKIPKKKEYFTLTDLSLSDGAKDKEQLYIRWIVTSTTPTDTSENDAVGDGGTGYIRNIIVKGEPIEGADISLPTVGLAKVPKSGAAGVESDAELTVKFSKSIALNEVYNASIVENDVTTLSAITVEANGDILKINHPEFAFEKTYTVTVPRELIKGTDGIALGNDIVWSFTTREDPKKPKLLNMTFNGDPKTSRAFAWYTDEGVEGSKIQVVEASKVIGGVFPEDKAITFTGTTEIVDVFMSTDDRDNENYTKYASHKVIANKLNPNTSYSYRVGNGDSDGWSKLGSFITDATDNQDFHFAVGSDSHAESSDTAQYWKDTLRKAIDKVDPKFFILTGDLVSYGDQEPEWQSLLGVPQEELANCPIVPVLGGHEVKDYDDDENTDTDNFYNHFNLPESVGIGGKTQKGSVYAFEYGDALFMQFNSQFAGELKDNGEIDYDDPEFYAELEWMKNQVAKSDAKWKFVSFHKGPYSIGDNGTLWEANRMKFYRKYLIPVFDELGVDLVFVGHDHMYMRSYQMLNDVPLKDYDKHNVTDPKGTVYMMNNSVGQKFYNRTTEDEDGNPIPEDKLPVDYWSWIDEQPDKKMFVDVSVKSNELKVTSYTAKIGEELVDYDNYTITRNDNKPEMVEEAKVVQSGAKAVISWKTPSGVTEPVRGFRIYEKDDKVKTNWSAYVPAVEGQKTYSYTVSGITSGEQYDFIVKAVGERNNSEPTSVKLLAEHVPGDIEPGKAFPQHTTYTSGTIKPNHVSQKQMDATVAKLYDEWKAKYLKLNPYNSDQYYVWYSDGDWFEENEITVSEAHGYGMMLLALMAGHDPEAKVCFDGMYRYFRAHPSEKNEDLMAWQQADQNGKIIDINGADSATDGDMDIAYALLLADTQWGSNGDIKYLAEAKKVIDAIMESDVNKNEWILKLGDWSSDSDPATRPSDFMLQHLKSFAKASGDNRWNNVIDKTYGIIGGIFSANSPNTGLLPDFVVKKDGKYIPAPPKFLESDTDGDYSYNSCRTPWRIATDYLVTGDTKAEEPLNKLNGWFRTKTDNKPENIKAGYKLDGTEIADYEDIAFSSPLMVSAMINPDNQQWLNDLWDYNMDVSTEDDLYFGNCIRLLSSIIVSGNWWTPCAESTSVQTVKEKISSLNVTSLADREAVVLARNLYEKLTDEQKLLVTNLELLEKAEAQILKLWIDSAEIASPVDEGLLSVLKDKYESMNDTQKTYVTNAGKLQELGEKFEKLKLSKEENYKKAKEVQRIIDRMQVLKPSDKSAAEEARAAYDKLTDDQKAVVTNYGLLKEAENKIAGWEGKPIPHIAPDNIAYAGTRSSIYGVRGKWLGTEDWQHITNQMHGYFPKAQPTYVWIVGHLNDEVGTGGCELEFEQPNDGIDYAAKSISFAPPPSNEGHLSHEEYLDYFDKHGIKVFLQVEAGFADMKTLMDLVFAKYGHHPSVIGFGVDVEWYYGVDEDSGLPVTDALAEDWDKHLKSINQAYRMFLKHYSLRWLPPTYRSDILFCNDSQSIGSIDGEVPGMYDDTMGFIPEFKAFADHFYPNEVLYQIGYRADAMWYYPLEKPVIKNLGERLAEVTRQKLGITWVDFSIKDPLTFPTLIKTDSEAASAVNTLLGYLRSSGNNMVGKRFAANNAILTDAMYVSRVREVVNSLTEAQRGLLKPDYLKNLINLEPKAIDIRIANLNSSLKLKDKAKVEAIRSAYAALTVDQKTQITKLSLLESAEKTIATLEYSGSGSGSSNNGGGSNSGGTTPIIQPVAVSGNIITATAKLDKSTGKAIAEIGSSNLDNAFANQKEDKFGSKLIEVKIPKLEGANSYEIALPLKTLSSEKVKNYITINTDIAAVKLPDNMLAGIPEASGKVASITIGQGDKSTLSDNMKQALGDRPLVQLTMKVDGKQISWKNENAAVKVSIPYKPTAEEQKDPEHIVIWYIDGAGNIVSVPNGRYDAVTGTVTFVTSHFSYYSIAYVHKTFADLSNVGWAEKQIEVLASKGIMNGISKDLFAPSDSITRADFLASLVKALGLTAEFTSNFDDIGLGSNYNEIGIAKALGITAGTGNNKFSPDISISRQDMMVLTVNALNKVKNLKSADTTNALNKFSDSGDIAKYAVSSLNTLVNEELITGSENKINPRAETTRAEASVFLYKIYNKYPV